MTRVGDVLAAHLACFGPLPEEDREAIGALPAEVREVDRLRDLLKRGNEPERRRSSSCRPAASTATR